MGDFKPTAMSFLVIPYAQQVFDVMPARRFHANDHIIILDNACLIMGSPALIFDPGGTEQLKLLNSSLSMRNFDWHLLIILDNKGSNKLESFEIIQPLVYDQALFVKLPEKRMVLVGFFVELEAYTSKTKTLSSFDVDNVVKLLIMFRGSLKKIRDTSSFIFNAGGYLNSTDFWAHKVLSYQLYDDATCMVPLLWISKVVNRMTPFDPGGREALPLLK